MERQHRGWDSLRTLGRQTWMQTGTLVGKNVRRTLLRHPAMVVVMALAVPVLVCVLLAFVKTLLAPPAVFGMGESHVVRTLPQAFDEARGSGKDKIVLVDSGHGAADVQRVLGEVEKTVLDYGEPMRVVRVEQEEALVSECRSTLRGVSSCFGAVVMRSSPSTGAGSIWNYTIRNDGFLAQAPFRFNVQRSTNDEEIYLLPLQRAVDRAILREGDDGAAAQRLDGLEEMPFTSQTQQEREGQIRASYHGAIIKFLGVGFISTTLPVAYHISGFIAAERESGMTQLIDTMMAGGSASWAQAVRIASYHAAFCAMYAPGWIVTSIVMHVAIFSNTRLPVVLLLQLLSGLALASFSIFSAAFFQRAQLSSISATLVALLLAVLAQSITAPSTGAVAVLAALFPPCNYVFFMVLMARFEKTGHGIDLALDAASPASWQLPGMLLFFLMAAQTMAYLVMAAVVERRLHATSFKGRRTGTSQDGTAVRLDGLTKIYQASWASRLRAKVARRAQGAEAVVAVDKLSLTAGKGQIVALLGGNGSGKSTTLDAIAGTCRPSSGSVSVDVQGGLGVAPQKNVLWHDVGVEEHVAIFNRLKAPLSPDSGAELTKLIKSIGLYSKRKCLAGTLSGGQKRKLQLGMMLTGGSGVCCMDEVSSGLDPLSRRKIWEIVVAERGKRTLIMTTHFLDEADYLADEIAVLSEGRLRAVGSSVQLKEAFGGGYRVRVDAAGAAAVPRGVKRLDSTTFGCASSRLAAQLIKELQAQGAGGCQLWSPTMESVFLRLAHEGNEASQVQADEEEQCMELMDGASVGLLQQVGVALRKRWTVLKRNWKPHALALGLPVVAAGLTSLYVQGRQPMGCSVAEQASSWGVEDAFSQQRRRYSISLLAGPSARFNATQARRLLHPVFAGWGSGAALRASVLGQVRLVDSFAAFTQHVAAERKTLTTALWLGGDGRPPTLAWLSNVFVSSPLLAQQLLHVLLAKTSIATTWAPFNVPFNPGVGDALSLVCYMGIALVCYPAFFTLYPTKERVAGVRALEYSSGLRPEALWCAYLVVDLCFVLGASALVVALWAWLSAIWYHLEYLFVVFFCYGLASTLLAYLVSAVARDQLSSFAWTAAYQALVLFAYVFAHLAVETFARPDRIDLLVLVCHYTISALAPIGSLVRALLVVTNLFSTACNGPSLSDKPGSFSMYGGPIFYLVVQAAVLFALVVLLDRGIRQPPPEQDVQDGAERGNASSLSMSSQDAQGEGLRVVDLTRTFGTKTALDKVSFSIRRGEVFALLGPNGAGKSTALSLIRGDAQPGGTASGHVVVHNKSLARSPAAARSLLGICPQADALDDMTVREHLDFYARVRGVAQVEHNVAAVLRAVGLDAFESRMGHALSGGNKRKLSLAIALMGNPAVVLLDEPSSGLDAASKRIMWRTLAATSSGRSILLTTHSMEEADALAGRVGILARRMLALGSPHGLRCRFGDALHVHLVCAGAPRTSNVQMQRLVAWLRHRLPLASLDSHTYHGHVRFLLPATHVLDSVSPSPLGHGPRDQDTEPIAVSACPSTAVGHLVVLLEEQKARLGIQHYSVSPVTLDHVFVAIVGQRRGSKDDDNNDVDDDYDDDDDDDDQTNATSGRAWMSRHGIRRLWARMCR
ncbi:hypothetical protein CDD81_7019 [Ophiocordyceps australis]|uniref:ABC transporter domain-containing protein n=1 Tax=Ophiocordyceps australis TaxID=1399860 RepID=A0A2C5YHT2_9HYPO|nr:hypothetical protein CDD81_7019 [Ophiocordyceps australis]